MAHFLFLRIDLHIFGGEGWVSGGGCVNTTDPVVRIVRLQCMFCSFLIIGSAHKCISNTTRLTSSISSTGSSGPVQNDNIITVTNTQMDNTLTKGSLNEQSYTSTTTIWFLKSSHRTCTWFSLTLGSRLVLFFLVLVILDDELSIGRNLEIICCFTFGRLFWIRCLGRTKIWSQWRTLNSFILMDSDVLSYNTSEIHC